MRSQCQIRGEGTLVQFLLFSCSFWQKSFQIIRFCHKNSGVGAPRQGNPGSATGSGDSLGWFDVVFHKKLQFGLGILVIFPDYLRCDAKSDPIGSFAETNQLSNITKNYGRIDIHNKFLQNDCQYYLNPGVPTTTPSSSTPGRPSSSPG